MIINGDSTEELKKFPDNHFDACVCDPPYHLISITKRLGKEGSAPAQEGTDGAFKRASKGFMGKTWDGGDIAHDPKFWAEVLRVLKPGAHLLAFGAPRTYHRLACAIEDAGFEIRDSIHWVYGSGFPKSYNIGKAETEIKGSSEWRGWGTALKPSHEPIVMARKPLSESSIARNVFKWGTGAINIDACRIGNDDIFITANGGKENFFHGGFDPEGKREGEKGKGRFPANFVLSHNEDCVSIGSRVEEVPIKIPEEWSGFGGKERLKYKQKVNTAAEEVFKCSPGCAVAELDRQSGVSISKRSQMRLPQGPFVLDKQTTINERRTERGFDGKGGASRFYKIFGGREQCGLKLTNETEEGMLDGESREVEKFTPNLKVDGCGNNITGRFPKDFTSIIKTEIEGIMTFPILNAWNNSLIGITTLKNENEIASKLLMKSNIESVQVVQNGKLLITTTSQKKEVLAGIVSNVLGQRFPTGEIITENTTTNTTENTENTEKTQFTFRYVAKPSKREKNAGLEEFEEKQREHRSDTGAGTWTEKGLAPAKNTHPTIKPIKLMRYLITMICPPGGTVLDPFAGSCTTGVAAI